MHASEIGEPFEREPLFFAEFGEDRRKCALDGLCAGHAALFRA